MIKNGKIWPIGIGIATFFVVLLGAWTIRETTLANITQSNSYMSNYHKVDDNMNDIINNIFNTFDANEDKINLLEELKDNPNTRLQTRVKRQLEISYNLKLKNREFNNEYYKNIFNKEQVMGDKKIINNYGQYVEGDNNGDMNQENTSTEDHNLDEKEKGWYDHWTAKYILLPTIVVVVGGIILKMIGGE